MGQGKGFRVHNFLITLRISRCMPNVQMFVQLGLGPFTNAAKMSLVIVCEEKRSCEPN